MKTKRCLNYFTIADFEREERWLNEMSRRGWNFVSTNGLIYRFEAGQAGEYLYKIELPDESRAGGNGEYERFPYGVRLGGGVALQGLDLSAEACRRWPDRDGGQYTCAVVVDKSCERIRCRHFMPFVIRIRRFECRLTRGCGRCCPRARPWESSCAASARRWP